MRKVSLLALLALSACESTAPECRWYYTVYELRADSSGTYYVAVPVDSSKTCPKLEWWR